MFVCIEREKYIYINIYIYIYIIYTRIYIYTYICTYINRTNASTYVAPYGRQGPEHPYNIEIPNTHTTSCSTTHDTFSTLHRPRIYSTRIYYNTRTCLKPTHHIYTALGFTTTHDTLKYPTHTTHMQHSNVLQHTNISDTHTPHIYSTRTNGSTCASASRLVSMAMSWRGEKIISTQRVFFGSR